MTCPCTSESLYNGCPFTFSPTGWSLPRLRHERIVFALHWNPHSRSSSAHSPAVNARPNAFPQEPQPHIRHKVSVAAHGTCNAYRADRRCQFDSAQRVRASADAMFRRRHVDDVQRLSNHRLPLMVEVGDVRHAAQSRTAGADTQHVHQWRVHAIGRPRHGGRSVQPAPECDAAFSMACMWSSTGNRIGVGAAGRLTRPGWRPP